MGEFKFLPSDYPAKPGCYLMKGKRGRVIYVGKAKSLRTRLSSYFQPSLRNGKAKRMVSYVESIEVIIVNNEYESLVLENNLIKLYRPWFNRVLKKATSGYFYIQMTGEKYPRFLRYRKNRYVKALEGLHEVKAGARFGPYLKSQHREVILEYVNDVFQVRTCKPLGHRVCLRYHLQRCTGICEGKVSSEAYLDQVHAAVQFLSQPQQSLVMDMRQKMQEYADILQFERAQKVKEQVEAVERGLQKQIVESDTKHDQTVLYFGSEGVLEARLQKGVLHSITLRRLPHEGDLEQVHRGFILSHYSAGSPDELIVNMLTDPAKVAELLTKENGRPVSVVIPQRGLKRGLLRLAEMNYRFRISSSRVDDGGYQQKRTKGRKA